MNILYLHGFASSPQSRKALFFAAKLDSLGIAIEIPDLTQGDFEHLTVSSQLKFIEKSVGKEAVTIIGSSLGGYLAALYAARQPLVERLVLIAPAFGFYDLWRAALGEEKISRWQAEGTMSVFHYGEGRELPLSYEFLKDAETYDPFPSISQRVLILHGDRDPVVPVGQSVQFAAANPQTKLVRFPESGHELTDVLEDVWRETEPFLFQEGGSN